MSVIIVVNNVWSRISGLRDINLVDNLDRITSFYVEGYQYSGAFRNGWYDSKTQKFKHWDGKKHLLTSKMVFPTGLLSLVKDFFKENSVEYVVKDERGEYQMEEIPIYGYTPRPYQIEAVESAIKNERGIIRVGTGGGKCLRLGTEVLKYDGSVCKVEDLCVNDLLMGPDSRPRRVLSKNIQYGDIYKIKPIRGNSWYCNDVHILTLKHTESNKIIDISLDEYQKKNKKFKHLYKQFSVGVDFAPQENTLPLDPYFLGVWFGDGNKTVTKSGRLLNVGVTTADPEIVDVINTIANNFKKNVRIATQNNNKSSVYFLHGRRGQINDLGRKIIDVVSPKLKVPHNYLTSSRENRLQFLAGWIDTDGYLHHNGYEITQKRKDWAEAIVFLARSLGFRALISISHNKKFNLDYYRVSISGDVSEIPVRIKRKKAEKRTQKKDASKTGFKVEPAGQDYYVGIELDGDGRFLLGDFTVTHNTLISAMITAKYNLPAMIYVVGKDLLYQFYKEFKKALGEENVGIIGDGLCEIKRFNICSVWTAITAFDVKQKVSLDDEDWNPEFIDLDSKQKKDIKNAIENSNVAIYDEAHFLATDTLQTIYKAGKKCKYIIGLSGTDWRDDGADLLLESVCGPRIYNMPASKLIEENYLVPANIVIFDVPEVNKNLGNKYISIYNTYITNNEVRNSMIIDSARSLINKGRRVLILVRYISHGNKLSEMISDIPHYFVNGELDSETRNSVKEEFENGDLKCLIASSVYDIGVDIPCLDALILAGGGKSSVRALQRIGRVIRKFPNKNNAIVVDFFDNAKFLDNHSGIRILVYETEKQFKIKFPVGFDVSKIKKTKKLIQKFNSWEK